jgi:hypothetical protein
MGRRLVAPLLLLVMLSGLLATAGSVAANTDYTCPDKSCAFSVPDFYNEVSNDASSVLFKDANSGGTFVAGLVPDFPPTATLDDAVTALQAQFATAPGYVADPRGVQSGTLAGNPARAIYYLRNNDNGDVVEVYTVSSVYQGKLYVLSFATTPDAEDAFVAAAQPVFDSWQFM